MPRKRVDGRRIAGRVDGLHRGAGRLLGYLLSHSQEAAQAVTFYDSPTCSGTLLHVAWLPAGSGPVYIRFREAGGGDEGIPFETGLSVNAGNCEVSVWSLGYQG